MINKSKPSYYLEVWRDIEGKLIGSDVSKTKGFPELKEWFDYHHTIHGRTATVYLFFSDHDIHNEELKQFAIKFMKGEYITYNVDLKNDRYTSQLGIDKTVHPHQ